MRFAIPQLTARTLYKLQPHFSQHLASDSFPEFICNPRPNALPNRRDDMPVAFAYQRGRTGQFLPFPGRRT
jgi:hypothetical protein